MTTTEPTFTEALETAVPFRTAGSLPGPRTFDMVTNALDSEDVQALSLELIHSRAHYQSLEYTLAGVEQNTSIILDGIREGAYPTPTTTKEAVALAVRVLSFGAIETAYDFAHQVGFFVGGLGMTVQEGLQVIFSDLDHSDPERQLSDDDLTALLDSE